MIIINVKRTFEPVHQEILKGCACPKCKDNNSLDLTLYQLHVDTGWIYSVTKKISGSVFCTACQTEIENVLWTDEIEHAFEQAKSRASIIKPYKKFSIFYKLLLAFIAILFSAAFYFGLTAYLNNQTKLKVLHQTEIGNKFLVSHSLRDANYKTEDKGISWATVRKIDGDTIFIQFNTEVLDIKDVNGASAPSDGYSGNTYKVSKAILIQKEHFTELTDNKTRLKSAYIWDYEKE